MTGVQTCALPISRAKLHLYGKHEARAGRKMGHFTVIGESAEAALAEAMHLRAVLCRTFALSSA